MNSKLLTKSLQERVKYYFGESSFKARTMQMAINDCYSIEIFSEFQIPRYRIEESLDEMDSYFFNGIENSPFLSAQKRSLEQEIETLKKELRVAQELSMKLSEALTDGAEYLESIDD